MKQSLLYLACILVFAIDSVIPGGLGVYDYVIPAALSTAVLLLSQFSLSNIKTTHIIRRKAYTVHISDSIYWLEGLAVLAAVMVGSEYVKYTGFWFVNYGNILNTINGIEVCILLAGVPVDDLFNRVSSRVRTLRGANRPVYQCADSYQIISD